MSVIQKAVLIFGGVESDWRMIGEAAVHVSVTPSDKCVFAGPAIIHGGTFRGGTFRGGYFLGGNFRGGTFYGGTFLGGTFYGGTFLGGTFHDGTFRGGTFHGGTFHDGYFHGDGYFRGGYFHGGYFLGGNFSQTPIQFAGVLPWVVVKQGSGDDRIAVGCECHSIDDWRNKTDEICEKHNVENLRDEVLRVVELVEFFGVKNG